MVSLIDSTTSALVSLALNATTMRHQAIAQNVANVNTPGYQGIGIRFESFLDDVRESLAAGRPVLPGALSGLQPELEFSDPAGMNASGPSLEIEMAKLAENTLHHQVLLKVLNRHYAILNTAVSGGR